MKELRLNLEYNVSLQEFYDLFLSNESTFFVDFHEQRGDSGRTSFVSNLERHQKDTMGRHQRWKEEERNEVSYPLQLSKAFCLPRVPIQPSNE